MKLPEISVRRPVFATVLSLLVLLIGLVAYQSLTVREYPRIDEPVVTVTTTFPGASAEVIESQVTKPLEDSIAGIDGVDILTSISRQERSQISVRFRLEKDPDSAAADVRDRVSRVRGRLPDDVDEPVVAKVEADAFPVIWMAFTSETMSPLEVTDIANRFVRPRLQTLTGVAEIRIFGERRYAMRVWLDPERLAAYGLTPADVENALRAQNLELPAGRIEGTQREFGVTAMTDLSTPEQFGEVVLRQDAGFAVRLRDVARIEQAPANERATVRFNGRPSVSIGVIRQATANPLDLSAAVHAALPRIRAELPEGLDVQVANDTSVFIDRSIKAVYVTILEAVVLVSLTVFVFLRTLRASVIPLIAIPVSLIGAFALMAAMGFTINTLTLLALVLAIGLVVDDAIVVLENIYRHIESGMKPFEAAIKGSREIAFAVVAMTLTLAAVYAPLAFTPGRTGRLFMEFALTLAGAVIVSGFVALTLSPMMCSKLLRHNPRPNRFDRGMETVLSGVTRGYQRLLTRTLMSFRWLIVGVMLLAAGGSWWLFTGMKSELSPMEDRGTITTIVNGPDGATLGYTQRYMAEIERIGNEVPEFDRVFIVSGNPTVAQGIAVMRTIDWDERERSTPEIARSIAPKLAALPGVSAFATTPASLGARIRDRPVNFVIQTSDSYEQLAEVAQTFLDAMGEHPGFQQADSDLRLNKPELRLELDRERVADLGLNVGVVARAVETMISGRNVTRYKRDGEQYDVIIQVSAEHRATPTDIEGIFVRGRNDEMIPLSSVVRVVETVAPRELNHFNQRRSVILTANLAADYSLGEALDFLDDLAERTLQDGYATDLDGISREFRSASGSLALVFVLALVFIYLVLSAQFESFVDPFVIMLSVPLSIVGALFALTYTGGTLNVYSQIGLITLIGLITKHGILIVEFSNQLRQQGWATLDATIEAASLRLRPILMTTGAMVFGALPLALASGAGAESRQQIGWVIVGGMSVGTLLTIFVVPTMYTLFARKATPGAITREVEDGPLADDHKAPVHP